MNLDVRECVRTDISFELQVNLNPVLTTPDPIIECNDQVTTLYDLTIRKDQITNNDTSIALTYFETQQDLDNNNPILDSNNLYKQHPHKNNPRTRHRIQPMYKNHHPRLDHRTVRQYKQNPHPDRRM